MKNINENDRLEYQNRLLKKIIALLVIIIGISITTGWEKKNNDLEVKNLKITNSIIFEKQKKELGKIEVKSSGIKLNFQNSLGNNSISLDCDLHSMIEVKESNAITTIDGDGIELKSKAKTKNYNILLNKKGFIAKLSDSNIEIISLCYDDKGNGLLVFKDKNDEEKINLKSENTKGGSIEVKLNKGGMALMHVNEENNGEIIIANKSLLISKTISPFKENKKKQ